MPKWTTPKDIAARIAELPPGLVVSDLWAAKGERIGSRWYFRVRDPLARDAKGRPVYITQAWGDYDEGEAWALKEHAKVRLGLVTSQTARMSELGPAYVKTLRPRGRTERYCKTVDQVWQGMVAAGADDLKDPLVNQRVERWLGGLMACRKGQLKPTPASARLRNQFLTVANSIIGHALGRPDRPLTHNPLGNVKAWPKETKSRKVFTVAELRKLVADSSRTAPARDFEETRAALRKAKDDKQAAAKALGIHITSLYKRLKVTTAPGDDPWWLYCMLGIYTGARPTEVRHMAWEHVDWHNRDLILPADHPGNKTSVERRIPLFDELFAVLEQRHKTAKKGPILAPEIVRMAEDTTTRAFQAYVERCGIDSKGRGPHTLRHNCGALLTACGVQDVAVLLHLGHESVTVSKEYRRSSPAFRNDVAGWDRQIRLRGKTKAK